MRSEHLVGILRSWSQFSKFETRKRGGYYARALGHAIFTQAENWEELRANVLEATAVHFEESSVHPRLVQLHYVNDELIPVEAI